MCVSERSGLAEAVAIIYILRRYYYYYCSTWYLVCISSFSFQPPRVHLVLHIVPDRDEELCEGRANVNVGELSVRIRYCCCCADMLVRKSTSARSRFSRLGGCCGCRRYDSDTYENTGTTKPPQGGLLLYLVCSDVTCTLCT